MILVAGSANLDFVIRAPHIPAPGETVLGHAFNTYPGGKGANQAVACARAGGAATRMLLALGNDPFAASIEDSLRGAGVGLHVVRVAGQPTGAAFICVSDRAENAITVASGANHALGPTHLPSLDGCTHLLRADVWFSEAMLEGGNLRLFTEARRRGIATSLDLNFDPYWSTGARKEIVRRKELLRETLGMVDLAHGNVRELCEFTDSPGLETALKRLTDQGVKAVVVHLGPRGAGFWAEGKLTVEPPSPAHAVVNSTGTGDVLSICMILLHARNDLSIQEKLRFSNQVVREFVEGGRALIPAI